MTMAIFTRTAFRREIRDNQLAKSVVAAILWAGILFRLPETRKKRERDRN